MNRSDRHLTPRPAGDDGIGLILIIGITAFVFAIAATAVSFATNGVGQSRNRTGFEQSLAVAEGGIDRTLSDLQSAYSDFNADYPVPGPVSVAEPTPWCEGVPVTWPASAPNGVFATEDDERDWARARLEEILATYPSCVQSNDKGEHVVLKPPSVPGATKFGKVYALSAVPSFADDRPRTRLVKSEYVFMPYRPTHAVLAAGALSVSSSTDVQAAYGIDPFTASVHSNMTVSGSGSPTVTGPVTSTEPSSFTNTNFPGGGVTQAAPQPIPKVNAASFYAQVPDKDPTAISTWYDLCPDGSVRPYSLSGPCTGTTVVGTADASQRVRGWHFDSAQRQWKATKDILSGTYYAHHGNMTVGTGNTSVPQLTLIASSQNAGTCATKLHGNIEWDHYAMGAPAFRNLWMYADADIVTHSNFSAGSGISAPPVVSGMFVAGDQIHLQTSSAGAVGSVVTANQCPSPPTLPTGLITTSEVKNPFIYYDPNSDAPFTSLITTSLWLDYSG